MAMKAQGNQRFNDDVLVVGVDIAKHRHVAVAEGPGGMLTKPLTFHNTKEGFQALEEWLHKTAVRFGTTKTVVGMEPTGHYWKPLLEHLQGYDYGIQLVSPVLTKRAKDMLDGSPLKTDAKDARVIADLIRQGKGRNHIAQDVVYQELRQLAELRRRLVVDRAALLNRLHRLLDHLFPELPTMFSSLDGMGIQALLRAAPTPSELLSLGVEGVTALLEKATRKRLGRVRAEAIIVAAQGSIACRKAIGAFRLELNLLLPRFTELASQRLQVEKTMVTLLEQVDYAPRLLTIPGIGVVTLAIVLGELGDLRGYRNSKQVLKMAGLNLFERSSGQRQGNRKIAKRGRSQLRHILYIAALRMVMKGKPLHGLYQKLSPNKPGQKVVVAGMRRLLKAMFAMVRDERGFEQEVFEVRPVMIRATKLAA